MANIFLSDVEGGAPKHRKAPGKFFMSLSNIAYSKYIFEPWWSSKCRGGGPGKLSYYPLRLLTDLQKMTRFQPRSVDLFADSLPLSGIFYRSLSVSTVLGEGLRALIAASHRLNCRLLFRPFFRCSYFSLFPTCF